MISNSRWAAIPAAVARARAAGLSPIAHSRSGLLDSMINRCNSKVPTPRRRWFGETTSWPALHSVPDSSWAYPSSCSASLTRKCCVVGCARRSRSTAASLSGFIWSTASASATNCSTLSISVSVSSVATAMVGTSDMDPR